MILLSLMMAIAPFSSAAAAPTYLTCTLQESGSTQEVYLVLDEEAQSTIIVQMFSGRSVRRRTIFSPGDVKILDEEAVWVVDRVSLDIRREVQIGSETFTDKGTCKVGAPLAGRAF